MPVHTPKAKPEPGEETAIGSQRLEAWADSIWYMTKDIETQLRFLRAEGRDVSVPEEQLHYDEHTRGLTLSGWDRATTVKRAGSNKVVEYVRANPGCTGRDIATALGVGNGKSAQLIKAASREIEIIAGPGRAHLHYIRGAVPPQTELGDLT
jgi:hypothetical protein